MLLPWLIFYHQLQHPFTNASLHWIFSILFHTFVTMYMLLLEFCSLSHHHLAKAHVLFFKAHSSDPFSLKPSLDLPALPPPTTTTVSSVVVLSKFPHSFVSKEHMALHLAVIFLSVWLYWILRPRLMKDSTNAQQQLAYTGAQSVSVIQGRKEGTKQRMILICIWT